MIDGVGDGVWEGMLPVVVTSGVFFYKTKLPCAVCPVTAPYTPFGGTRAHRRPISNQNPVSIGNRK
jgi:hypothetical protein